MLATSTKQTIFLLICLGFFIIALFSPIASNEYFPKLPDFANYLVGIIQAKAALDEGQLILRVTPDLYDGWRYAFFQFSSPLAYMITGAVYKWITPANPFIAFKLVLFAGFYLAGIYIYRLANEFTHSHWAAVLAAVLYLMSPYLLINFGVRGDLTETLAMGIMPLVLFYSIKCHDYPSLKYFCICAIAWFALATIHLVTFVFASVFIAAFIICLNIQNQNHLRKLVFLTGAYIFSCVLGLWYLAPLPVFFNQSYSHYVLCNPFITNWMTPIAALLSPAAVSPMPLPGNGNGLTSLGFYIGIGWPMLAGVVLLVYQKWVIMDKRVPDFVIPLLVLFLLALLLIWTPLNFWTGFPSYFKLVQYGFRLLIQLMWIGSLLFAVALTVMFGEKLQFPQVMLGVLLIVMANSSWLRTNKSADVKVADLVKHGEFHEWGANSFVTNPLLLTEVEYPKQLKSVQQTKNDCHQVSAMTVCEVQTKKAEITQLPILYYPNMMQVKINGVSTSYFPIAKNPKSGNFKEINPMLVGVDLPIGKNQVEVKFVGYVWANFISALAWGLMILVLAYRVVLQVFQRTEAVAEL